MANHKPKPQVFVSYSQLDEQAKDFVNRHLKVLQTAGDIEVWNDRELTVDDDWF